MKSLFNEEVPDTPVKPTHGKFKKWKIELDKLYQALKQIEPPKEVERE